MLANFLLKHHTSSDQESAQEFELLVQHLLLATNQGASCIHLHEFLAERSPEQWSQWLRSGEEDSIVDGPDGFSPLVLKSNRLYLRRYFQHEINVANSLLNHIAQPSPTLPKQIRPLLKQLFSGEASSDQRRAAEIALTNNFSIISGGPGTGKTTTVVKILFLLTLIGRTNGSHDTLLLAPTGKAADRLSQSIQAGIERLMTEMPEDAIITSSLPREASTIHRALGYRPDSIEFRHHKENPLSAKLVIIDETSMVDLPMMARLLDAILPDSQIIFLGDQHQLASVQVGSVLADLMQAANQQSLLSPCSAVLQQTFRTTGAIKECCDQIRAGDSNEAWKIAAEHSHAEQQLPLSIHSKSGSLLTEELPLSLHAALEPFFLRHWLPVLQDSQKSPQEKLNAIDQFRILTPTHHGPYGINAMNQTIHRLLTQYGFDTSSPWFIGRSIIVTSNNYSAKVFNGDTGLVLPHSDHSQSPQQGQDKAITVHFPGPKGTSRMVSPTRLPDVETAWALTIHRTQGSEYDHILLILPPSSSESKQQDFITRELLYTGLSRAKHSATIWTDKNHFQAIINKSILRPSGLSTLFQATNK